MPEIVGGSPQLPELSPPAQVEAKAIKRVEPVIPLSAKLYRGAYEVVVVVSIDATGKVTEAHPLKKDSYGFGQAAVQAVKKWTFSPATQNDQAVPSTQVILFVFRGKQ
jgi:TonB family protein